MATPNYLLSKSDLNLDAAEKLKKGPNNHHSPSISRSYYACYLRIVHVISNVIGYNEGRFNSEYNSYKIRNPGGKHDFSIHLLYTTIRGNNLKDAIDFKNEILGLKKLRIDADYRNILQEKDLSDSAYLKAEKVIKILKRQF